MFVRTLVGIAIGLVLAPTAGAAEMQWFDWRGAARMPQTPFGSTAVIGVTTMAGVPALRARYDLHRVEALPQLRAIEVRVDHAALRRLIARAPTDPLVRYVSPLGAVRRPLALPNDPLLTAIDPASGLPFEWQFTAAHVDRALDYTAGSPGVTVGTIDTGVADVPDLTGKVDSRWDIARDGTVTQASGGNDDSGHGTAVASLIAANVGDGFGMAGFGGAAHVVAIRAGDSGFTDTAVAIALTKLDSLGVRIVNMSFGGPEPDAPIVVDAIHKAAADGMLLVAAIGNNDGFAGYPAADLQPPGGARSYGLAVGASDGVGTRASFSNSGRHLSLLAPGVESVPCSGVLVAMAPTSEFDRTCYSIFTRSAGGRYAYLAGTSFSAPEVAGVAALVWSARPGLKNYQVADIIKQAAQRGPSTGWTPGMGCGLLDAGAALALATSRSDTAWAAKRAPGAESCSVTGDREAAWPSRDPMPTVRAVLVDGEWGRPVTLRFRVDEDTHRISAAITVRRNGVTVGHVSSGLFRVDPGAVYGLLWRPAHIQRTGAYTFCVTLANRFAQRSGRSCAPIVFSR